MGVLKVPGETIIPKPLTEGLWKGSNIVEVFDTGGKTRMSCGIHELFASVTVVEKAPVDDVLYILEGEIEIEADGVRQLFKAGDFAYLYKGCRQTFTVRKHVKHIYICYPANWATAQDVTE